jgi:hypothetical protein
MHTVGVSEAKNRLTALLVPADPGFDRDQARGAAAGLLEAAKGLSRDGLTIRELIDEGRR